VAVAIGEKYPQLDVHPEQLHVWQIRWATEQAVGFQQYLRKTDPFAVIDSEWPLVPLTPERKIRGALADLAERYEETAARAVSDVAKARARQISQAAKDIRTVLTTGRIPHWLMTDAELEQHGTPEENAS
jgi:hypothetical protein